MRTMLDTEKNQTVGRSRREISPRNFQGHGWRKGKIGQGKRGHALSGMPSNCTWSFIEDDQTDAVGIFAGLLPRDMRGH